jgi:membrane protein
MAWRAWVIVKQTYWGFVHDQCTQLAAAISYYVIVSLVPVALVLVSILGFVLTSEGRRADLVDHILNALPLSETEGRDAVAKALDSVQRVRGPIAIIGLFTTMWSSSAMFASIRKALNSVWRIDEHRPWARAKLIDFAQLGLLGAILLGSITLTGFMRYIREASADHAGPLTNANALWEIPPIVAPAVLTFITFALLYRVVPASHPRWRDVLPGALAGTILFEALKNGFAFYVTNYNNYDVIYGSLAGILLFLFFVYLASNVLLIGAELASVLQRYHSGQLDAELFPVNPRPPIPILVARAVKGLFVRADAP